MRHSTQGQGKCKHVCTLLNLLMYISTYSDVLHCPWWHMKLELNIGFVINCQPYRHRKMVHGKNMRKNTVLHAITTR